MTLTTFPLKFPGVLVSALITVATLTGCHGGGGSSPAVAAFGDNLGGTLRGLVGSGRRRNEHIRIAICQQGAAPRSAPIWPESRSNFGACSHVP